MKKSRILFVLKYREQPNDYSTGWGDGHGKFLHSGLYNSAKFVSDMLYQKGYDTKLVHVVDNNKIHKEIVEFKATHVIIEAYWVVPDKFAELMRVCPNVKFIIRNHSETPFLANEGMAFDWSLRYLNYDNVCVSCNSPRMTKDLRSLVKKLHPTWSNEYIAYRTPFLPNYYPLDYYYPHTSSWNKNHIDIGCFGAIRPLKNHVTQAIAAIEWSHQQKKPLKFHINSQRVEMNGSPILNNLRGIFSKYDDCHLIEHSWKRHNVFELLIGQMDVLMQVSFSETFNIVAADAVSKNVPIVVSPEVSWASWFTKANPTSTTSMVNALNRVMTLKKLIPSWNQNIDGLITYNMISELNWENYFG